MILFVYKKNQNRMKWDSNKFLRILVYVDKNAYEWTNSALN